MPYFMKKYHLFAVASLITAGLLQSPVTSASHAAQGDCQLFNDTGKRVCGKFLDYWTFHGSLTQQGYPISDEFYETSALDGKTYTVQYFQRAVFELHPENVGTPYEVLLTQLGTYNYRVHHTSLKLPDTGADVIRYNELASDRYF